MRARTAVIAVVVLVGAAIAAYGLARMKTPMPESMGTATAAPALVAIDLEIKVHFTATLDATAAGIITSGGSALLQNTEFAGDVACAVALNPKKLGGFRIGNGVVNSPEAFNALFIDNDNPAVARQAGSSWQVRVVSEITWCSRYVPAGGCADVNGRRIAVVRRAPIIESILWAHEVGHTQGLDHRSDSSVALMKGSILPQHNMLNQGECDAFRK